MSVKPVIDTTNSIFTSAMKPVKNPVQWLQSNETSLVEKICAIVLTCLTVLFLGNHAGYFGVSKFVAVVLGGVLAFYAFGKGNKAAPIQSSKEDAVSQPQETEPEKHLSELDQLLADRDISSEFASTMVDVEKENALLSNRLLLSVLAVHAPYNTWPVVATLSETDPNPPSVDSFAGDLAKGYYVSEGQKMPMILYKVKGYNDQIYLGILIRYCGVWKCNNFYNPSRFGIPDMDNVGSLIVQRFASMNLKKSVLQWASE